MADKLYLRNVDAKTHETAKVAAAVRGITLAEYLKRLVDAHQDLLASAAIGNATAYSILQGNRLEGVTA